MEFKYVDFVILNKLEIHQVEYLKGILKEFQMVVLQPATLENVLKYSIAKGLWYEMNKRTSKENPPKKSNLKMKSYQGIILLQALNHNGNEGRIYKYKDAIVKQLI